MMIRKHLALRLAAVAAAVLPAIAAEAAGTIGYLYPAGAKRGTGISVLVGGQGLWKIRTVRITGGGVRCDKAETVGGIPFGPGNAAQRKFLEAWIKNIAAGKPEEKPPIPEDTREWNKCRYWDNLDKLTPLETEIVHRKLYQRTNSLQMSPAIRQMVILHLTIDPEAKPGRRELRLVCGNGITNPLAFHVGDVPEIDEPRYTAPYLKPAPRPVFTAPATLNGQIRPGETDRFDFNADAGAEFTFRCLGRALIPFLGDGVPGHFQPVLEIFDERGRSVAYADDRRFDPDPVLVFKAPAGGRYTLAVRDALYRGREDFVYRIEVRSGILPKTVIPPPPAEFRELPLLPAHQAAETTLQAPLMVRGAFDGAASGGFRFRFRAAAGEKTVIETFARRLGSPADTRLRLLDGSGGLLAAADDLKGPRIGLTYHQADSRIDFTAPRDGEYTLCLEEAAGAAGPDYFFYLRIDRPRPDFTLWTAPSVLAVSPFGAAYPVKIIAVRRDGFRGEIRLRAKSETPIAVVGPDTIPAESDEARITLKCYRAPTRHFLNRALPFRLYGEANGVTRPVRAGDEAMQAFAYTHIIPAEELLLFHGGGIAGENRIHWFDRPPFRIRMRRGTTDKLQLVCLPEPGEGETLEFSLLDNPAGLSLGKAEYANGIFTIPFAASEKCAPGASNQVVTVRFSYNTKPDKQGKTKRITATLPLPSFRLEVE